MIYYLKALIDAAVPLYHIGQGDMAAQKGRWYMVEQILYVTNNNQ